MGTLGGMSRVSTDTLSTGGLPKCNPSVHTRLIHQGIGMTLGRVESAPRSKVDDVAGTSERRKLRASTDTLSSGGSPKHDLMVDTCLNFPVAFAEIDTIGATLGRGGVRSRVTGKSG